jgi:ribosomal protein S8
MKYRNGLPVLRRVSHVSKSSFRVHVTRDELGRLLSGKRARNTAGIGMGEILIVKTPDDPTIGRVGIAAYMDGWQAWRAGLGGEVMVRAA